MSHHLTDEQMLLLQEGELAGREAIAAAEHLQACEACAHRNDLLLQIGETVQEARRTSPRPDSGQRASLLAALQAEPVQTTRWWQRSPLAAALRPAMLLRVGMVAALLVLAVTWRQAYSPLQDRMAAFEETGPEPNHVLTPGAASPIALEQLCSESDDNLDPAVSPEKQHAVFQAYGMSDKAAHAYQVDYLINPQLGGNDQLENLWPEPYHATVWNATAKDALETKLHGMVCEKQISLQEAQYDLSNDWIAAYKKYFHASRPIGSMSADLATPAMSLEAASTPAPEFLP